LVCYATTQLAIQLHQERIQVVRSNSVTWKHPAESNCTPAMDLGFEDICKRKNTNKRGINKTHIHKHATSRNSTYTKKELMLCRILLLYCCVCIILVFCPKYFAWLLIIMYCGSVHFIPIYFSRSPGSVELLSSVQFIQFNSFPFIF